MDLQTFSLDQVSKHNSRSNLWIIIEGNVYDCTRFLDEHPGGEEVILELAGMDATEGFEQIGHSPDAIDLLKTMIVGKVAINPVESEMNDNKPVETPAETVVTEKEGDKGLFGA